MMILKCHVGGDDAICELLNVLGYSDVVIEYKKIFKWYA